uniref:60S ribosomal protein L7 n=1 Tax=Anopheles funestus TaxID=62324 RepID=A0A182RFP2_ANOFN
MEKYAIPNKLPSEEVSVLTHRKGRLKQLAKRAEQAPPPKKKRTSFRKITTVVGHSRIAERDAKRIKRNFFKKGILPKNEAIYKENQLVLVFRHRGIKFLPNKDVLKTLVRLGLQFQRSATLHRLTPEVFAQLKVVEPYVIWGYPNISVVQELLFKYVRLRCNETGTESKKPVPLTSNKQVEDMFGSLGMLCVDDLVHEIMTVGPHFDAIREQLRSFLLKNPAGGWKNPKQKGKLRSIGGEAGFRGTDINLFFQRVL